MEINQPLISIITVSYNAVKTIEQTILSVLNQSYSNIEYLLIDGGSTDGTVNIIEKYANRLAYWVSEPDKGIYDAMNKGIELAKGDLIGLVNSDDWYENVLEDLAHLYMIKGNNSIYHGDVNLHFMHKASLVYKPCLDLSKFYKGTIINHPTVFVPKKIYTDLGLFNIKYKIAADYDFLIRCYKESINFVYLDKVISNMRCEGVSNQQARKGYEEACQIAISHGFSKNKVYFLYYYKCLLNMLALLKRRLIIF